MRLPMATIVDYSVQGRFYTSPEENKQKGGNWVIVKRMLYLATAALVAMLILVPSALAQVDMVPGDDDPHAPEPNVIVVEHEELQRIAGQTLPKSGGPAIGGLSVVLPAGALLLGSGVLAYAVLRRR
jgi:hypothetical protein